MNAPTIQYFDVEVVGTELGADRTAVLYLMQTLCQVGKSLIGLSWVVSSDRLAGLSGKQTDTFSVRCDP